MNGGFIFLIIFIIILVICGGAFFIYRFLGNKKSLLSKKEYEINRLNQENFEKYGEYLSPETKQMYYELELEDLKRL